MYVIHGEVLLIHTSNCNVSGVIILRKMKKNGPDPFFTSFDNDTSEYSGKVEDRYWMMNGDSG